MDIVKQVRPEIHADAFRYFRNTTEQFTIQAINMSLLEFSFLAEFNQMKMFSIESCIDVHLRNFPEDLPNLTSLKIDLSKGLDGLANFPQLTTGLESLNLHSNGLTDEGLYRILEWMLTGPSKTTLIRLRLGYNALSHIPKQLEQFPKLKNVHLDGQVPGFGNLSRIRLPASVQYLVLRSCRITNVEPDAFKGCTSITQAQSLLKFNQN